MEANYNLANLLAARGGLETAVGFYTTALSADPEFTAAHFNLARVLEKLDRKQAAAACWRAYLELEPNSIFATEIRRRLQAWQDEYRSGYAAFRSQSCLRLQSRFLPPPQRANISFRNNCMACQDRLAALGS